MAATLPASPTPQDQHAAALDLRRDRQPADGGDRDRDADRHQGDAVDQRGQDLASAGSRRCAARPPAAPPGRPPAGQARSRRASESRWPASASSASEPVIRPPTTPTTSSAALIAARSTSAAGCPRAAPPARASPPCRPAHVPPAGRPLGPRACREGLAGRAAALLGGTGAVLWLRPPSVAAALCDSPARPRGARR